MSKIYFLFCLMVISLPNLQAQELLQSPVNKDCNEMLAESLLQVIVNDIVPLTSDGVKKGNKLFGAALLQKSDYSLVLAATNNETENPLWHGEVHLLKLFYEMPESERPDPKDLIFLATHEPCPLCLSAITWGGYDNFYYLFSYEDSRDEFSIPHDLKILKEVFKQDNGAYASQNYYWSSAQVVNLVKNCPDDIQANILNKTQGIKKLYDELSEEYQKHKNAVNMPLK